MPTPLNYRGISFAAQMDDTNKTKALMIYFSHWGVAKARKQRQLDGIRSTMSKIRRSLIPDDEDVGQPLVDQLVEYNEFYHLTGYYWQKLVRMLLQQIGGIPDQYPYPCIVSSRVAANLNIRDNRLARLDVSDSQMRSVDAIVALY